MLRMRWNSVTSATPDNVTSLHRRADLEIRSLLDDPRLRRACGLDPHTSEVPAVKANPKLRFDRRRLLEAAAA